MDAIARTRVVRPARFCALIAILLICLGLAVLIGYWAGRVARDKGRDFAAFMAFGTAASLLGLLPGLIVVLVAYLIGPATPAEPATAPASAPPTPSTEVHVPQPPPPPPEPREAQGDDRGEAVRSPEGGYEYTPPPPSKTPRT